MSKSDGNEFGSRKWTFVSMIVTWASALIVGIASIQYANYVDVRSDRRWCGVVSAMDKSYRESPPVTQTGKQLAEEMAKLREQFGC